MDPIAEVYALAPVQHRPEAVGVRVVFPLGLSVDEDIARAVAPNVAKRIYPERYFGETLYIERTDDGFECAVEVLGTPFSAVRVG